VSDLVVAFGARLNDRHTGVIKTYARHAGR
jgi:glyoxylate carboligase